MNTSTAPVLSRALLAAGLALLASASFVQTASAAAADAAKPYKVINTAQFPGTGGLDYVFADSAERRLYVARGPQVHVFDLDTLKEVGAVAGQGHGAVVDPASHHGFVSSRPIVMFDTKTLATIKTIDVQGSPDGMLFEPLTERVYVLSHSAPNVTVIDGKDGTVVGTIDLGGAPEQGQSDGKGHVYIDVEDGANVAVVDAKTLTVTAHYPLGTASTPAGLGLDIKNGILFAMCRQPGPGTCVILSAADGKILTSLPLAGGSDGGLFNPATMEAFSSSGGGTGTLTVIKENSPTSFEIEQTVPTKSGAKTLTLDSKTNQVIVITTEAMPPAAPAATPPATPAAPPAAPAVASAKPPTAPPAGGPPLADGAAPPRRGGGGRGGRGGGGPAFLDLIVVGR
jgi:DNA-binding beta-propeller fold protein YncE